MQQLSVTRLDGCWLMMWCIWWYDRGLFGVRGWVLGACCFSRQRYNRISDWYRSPKRLDGCWFMLCQVWYDRGLSGAGGWGWELAASVRQWYNRITDLYRFPTRLDSCWWMLCQTRRWQEIIWCWMLGVGSFFSKTVVTVTDWKRSLYKIGWLLVDAVSHLKRWQQSII
jgi:hypothetical protein